MDILKNTGLAALVALRASVEPLHYSMMGTKGLVRGLNGCPSEVRERVGVPRQISRQISGQIAGSRVSVLYSSLHWHCWMESYPVRVYVVYARVLDKVSAQNGSARISPKHQPKGKHIVMSIFDAINNKLDQVAESGAALAQRSGKYLTFRSHDVNPFKTNYMGLQGLAAIRFEDLVLVEVNLGKQEKGQEGQKTGVWQLILEMTLAAPGARLGAWEGEEFKEFTKVYESPTYKRAVDQTPLIYAQFMNANFDETSPLTEDEIQPGPELVEFHDLLIEQKFIARKERPGNTLVPTKRKRLWSVEAQNRQSNNIPNDLREKVGNGLEIVQFTLAPPTQEREGQFEDFLSAWMGRLDKSLVDQESEDEAKRDAAGKNLSSLTGTQVGDDGVERVGRASIPEVTFNVKTLRKQGRETVEDNNDVSFSFWPPRGADAVNQ